MSALLRQVGGEHYKNLVIQPVEYIHLNELGFIEGSVIKYVTRWKDKGGYTDIRKAIHLLELLLELECELPKDAKPSECERCPGVSHYDAGYRRVGSGWVKSWPGVKDV